VCKLILTLPIIHSAIYQAQMEKLPDLSGNLIWMPISRFWILDSDAGFQIPVRKNILHGSVTNYFHSFFAAWLAAA